MCIIIFSHSDYFYLWDVISEYISPLTSQLHTIFLSNCQNKHKLPVGFAQYIEYDSEKCYAQRWLSVLQKITHKYIVVIHDVCILVNCDVVKIINLFNALNDNSIDRCSLNVFNGTDVINVDIPICNLNDANLIGNTMVPYDVCPSIWNKTSFLSLWENFPKENYASSELNNNLQKYCKNNFRCYGLQKTSNKISYCIGRPYYDFFKILHITIKGELMHPLDVYMDTLTEYGYIVEKYKLNAKIKINHNYAFVLNFKMI